MKICTIAALVLGSVLCLTVTTASAAVVVDPVTGLLYVTTDTVYGVGAAAVNTWNGTAVRNADVNVNRTTNVVNPRVETPRNPGVNRVGRYR